MKSIAWISTAVIPYSETNKEFSNAATNDFIRCMVDGLDKLGVVSTLLVPEKSDSKHRHVTFPGSLQATLAEDSKADITGTATGEALHGMVEWAWNHKHEFDLIVNVGHDFLPIFMVGKFKTPLITLPNLCNTTTQMDNLIRQKAKEFPQHVCFFSQAQRTILGNDENPILTQPFDSSEFIDADNFRLSPSRGLGWAGRITPEKGLARALEIAQTLGKPLWAAGPIHDQAYFQELNRAYPQTLNYLGCLDRRNLYATLAQTEVFLQTQIQGQQEAFGRTTAEAFLAGCPAIYHNCGANAELAEATDGGIMLAHHSGQEIVAYEQAMRLSRKTIQTKAKLLFDKDLVATKFLALAKMLR